MVFDVVVAADFDWGIGRDNALPWPRLRGDLAHFKATTSTASAGRRNAVVFGRKTWESREIAGRPLPRRLNVVVSRRAIAVPDGVVVAASLDEAIDGHDAASLFVCGGAEIYRLALGHHALRFVYLTRVQGSYGCDVRVTDLDVSFTPDPSWSAATHEESGVRYQIQRLRRR